MKNKTDQFGSTFNGTNTTERKITNFSTNSIKTLKGKLQELERQIIFAAECMNEHKLLINSVKDDKEKFQEILKAKSEEINNKLTNKLDDVEKEMNQHFTDQDKENERLQKQIDKLKDEKTGLQNNLIKLQKKISELELNVGNLEEIH